MAAKDDVQALLFDVFGTVVDWRSGVIREVTVLAAEQGVDIDAASFADRWRAAYRPAMNQVRTGELPWTNLLDAQGAGDFARGYAVEQIPANFVVGRDGKIVALEVGVDALESEISRAVGGGR